MPIDQSEAREEALYAGLADNAPHRPRRRPRRPRRRSSRPRDLIVGGVTLAVGLGILATAVVQPELTDLWPAAERASSSPARAARAERRQQPPTPRASQPVLPASIPLASVRAEAPPPQAAPAAAPPPPEAAAPAPPAAAPVRTAVAPPPPRVAPLPETGGRLTLPPEMAGTPPAPARPAAEPPPPAVRSTHATASFDCAPADAGAAEQMVCSDPELAAADRELAQAYGRAMRSGAVDPRDLDLDQRDWAALREDAARYSRRALASVYAQRIRELDDIAADGPPGDARR